MPLSTQADGTKFGKSEAGTVWLDQEKTSAYEMYQFLVNSEDEKVIDYLKKLTFLSKAEIEALEKAVQTQPHKREAQKALAKEVVTFLHGEAAYETAMRITNALFGGDVKALRLTERRDALKSFAAVDVDDAIKCIDFLVNGKVAASRREAREWLKQGSIQINGVKVQDENQIISKADALVDDLHLVKRGKRNYSVIRQH